MIDYWELSKDFVQGDIVQRVLPGQGISPYTGRVLAVLPGIGFLDVQWPFGTERVSPEELLKMNPMEVKIQPPSVTFDYHPGLDAKKASQFWRTVEVPPGFHKDLGLLWSRKASEVQAYDELFHRYAAYADDEVIRDEVAKFYRVAYRSMDLLFRQVANTKTAAYWASKDRNYRATKGEISSGRPNCPRCGSSMRSTVYKMREGARSKLFACPSCLYLIKQDNILGPGGEPVAWGGRGLEAKVHPTDDAREEYLKKHPKADPSKHTVKGEGDEKGKKEDEKGEDKGEGKKEEPKKERKSISPEAAKKMKGEVAKLKDEYDLSDEQKKGLADFEKEIDGGEAEDYLEKGLKDWKDALRDTTKKAEPKKEEPKKEEPKKEEKPKDEKAEGKKEPAKSTPQQQAVTEMSVLVGGQPRSGDDIDSVNKGIKTLWDQAKTLTGLEKKKIHDALHKGYAAAEKEGGLTSKKGWEAFQKATRWAVRQMTKELGGEDPVEAQRAKAKDELKSLSGKDLKKTIGQATRKLPRDLQNDLIEILDAYDPQDMSDLEAAMEDERVSKIDQAKIKNEMAKAWTSRQKSAAGSFDDAIALLA